MSLDCESSYPIVCIGFGLPAKRTDRLYVGYVALCPERDVASQGDSVEEASSNLREAVELFLETASPSEVTARMHDEVYVAALEARAGVRGGAPVPGLITVAHRPISRVATGGRTAFLF